MHFTPPPGTPMPPTPQSASFGGGGAPPSANGAGAGAGGQGGQQGPPQLVLPNPALAQTNPEMKKKTELKYTDANFSPVSFLCFRFGGFVGWFRFFATAQTALLDYAFLLICQHANRADTFSVM